MLPVLLILSGALLAGAYPTLDPELVSALVETDTQLDRLNLLSTDKDWFFDFFNSTGYTTNPGSVVTANAANFPAVVGNGMAMAMLTLGPCAMLPPHIHPRATNFVVAMKGSTMTTFIEENGARTVQNLLHPGQMTIFPRAAVHTMVNTGCDVAQLVSALNSEDPGTHNLANGIFGLPLDLVYVAFGGAIDVEAIVKAIPPIGTGSIAGTEECKKRCGIY